MGRFSNLEFKDDERFAADERSRSEEPRDERFYLRLAEEDYRSGRFERALRYYSRAVDCNSTLVAAWVGQVQMLVELGEYKEARLWADKALEMHRDQPKLLSQKGVAYARLGDTKRALAFSDASIEKKGSSPEVWLARGEALLAAGKTHDDYCFVRAEGEAKGDWFVTLLAARVLYLYGQFARALSYVQRAIERDASRAFSWYTLGSCQLALGLAGAAERSYAQALTLDRDFTPAREALSRLDRSSLVGRLWGGLRGLFRRRI